MSNDDLKPRVTDVRVRVVCDRCGGTGIGTGADNLICSCPDCDGHGRREAWVPISELRFHQEAIR